VQPDVREQHPLQLAPQGAGDAAQEGGRRPLPAGPGAAPGRRAGRRVFLSRRCTFFQHVVYRTWIFSLPSTSIIVSVVLVARTQNSRSFIRSN